VKQLLLFIFCLLAFTLSAGTNPKIKAYFNQPVNTAFSSGTNASYLPNLVDDTLVAYINRAKYSIDIAIYELQESSGMAHISAAIDTAHAHGVAVRIIYDGKDNLSNLSQITSSIPRLASPSGSSYNIMHNKFMIIDANSTNAADAIVWTGSFNWTLTMFNNDYNNAIIFQDQPLAQAYLAEFNQMWGSSTATPNAANSKFGPFKTATTAHTFTIGGSTVNLYFSPSDGTNNQIINAINTCNKELFFGIYTFTEGPNASAISTLYATSGNTVKGIMDQFSLGYTAYNTLSPVMGANLRIYNGSYVYHNKFMVVDPDYTSSDPLVTTGSHNWSNTADTKNDENMVIVHDSSIANQYLQSIAQNIIGLGGSISPVHTSSGIETMVDDIIQIFPNPTSDQLNIKTTEASQHTLIISDVSGQTIKTISFAGEHTSLSLAGFDAGVYFISVSSCSGMKKYRVVKL
jgi:phosphatidylserine/phosphatidylglycerophosphate/cardiolipin synthase-like enzyme